MTSSNGIIEYTYRWTHWPPSPWCCLNFFCLVFSPSKIGTSQKFWVFTVFSESSEDHRGKLSESKGATSLLFGKRTVAVSHPLPSYNSWGRASFSCHTKMLLGPCPNPIRLHSQIHKVSGPKPSETRQPTPFTSPGLSHFNFAQNRKKIFQADRKHQNEIEFNWVEGLLLLDFLWRVFFVCLLVSLLVTVVQLWMKRLNVKADVIGKQVGNGEYGGGDWVSKHPEGSEKSGNFSRMLSATCSQCTKLPHPTKHGTTTQCIMQQHILPLVFQRNTNQHIFQLRCHWMAYSALLV